LILSIISSILNLPISASYDTSTDILLIRHLVLYLGASIWLSALCVGQPDTSRPLIPKQEVRAVWITTVLGLDWPKSQDPEEQQRTLLDMIVKLSAAHFNTIFFQVRGRADAMYRSRYEPWSQLLTGTLG